MFKKCLLMMLVLSVIFCLTSCGKKEAEDVDYDWDEPVVNQVIPG